MTRRASGFSLIELLVVIAVVAVLIGVLLPVLRSARVAATNVNCQVRLRELGTLVNAHAVDNNGLLPDMGMPGPGSPPRTATTITFLHGFDAYWTGASATRNPLGLPQDDPEQFNCPANPEFRDDASWTTAWGFPETTVSTYVYNGNRSWVWAQIEANNTAKVKVFGGGPVSEVFPRRITELGARTTVFHDRMSGVFDNALGRRLINHTQGNSQKAGGKNIAFGDGRVEFVPVEETADIVGVDGVRYRGKRRD
ncbi:MAG: prepilin-type N-terminal cleavage/methylation domain-containing protein [Planctomycetota bacterium]